MSTCIVATCQMNSQDEKDENITTALSFINQAADRGADLVSLPEMFNFRGPVNRYTEISETVPGPTTAALADVASERDIYIHSGSFFEKSSEPEKVYNTSVVIDDAGDIIATYRKIHLFDVDIGNQVYDEESSYTEPGDAPVVVDTPVGVLGLSICYDLRFPQYYTALADQGATILFVPSSFTLFTGKDHWEPLLRARAIENQTYIIAANQIGSAPEAGPRYGRSVIVDPWGNIISRSSDRPGISLATIDLDYLQEVRTELPALNHKRKDVY